MSWETLSRERSSMVNSAWVLPNISLYSVQLPRHKVSCPPWHSVLLFISSHQSIAVLHFSFISCVSFQCYVCIICVLLYLVRSKVPSAKACCFPHFAELRTGSARHQAVAFRQCLPGACPHGLSRINGDIDEPNKWINLIETETCWHRAFMNQSADERCRRSAQIDSDKQCSYFLKYLYTIRWTQRFSISV